MRSSQTQALLTATSSAICKFLPLTLYFPLQAGLSLYADLYLATMIPDVSVMNLLIYSLFLTVVGAIANAHAALEAGATHIDTSVLGIGKLHGCPFVEAPSISSVNAPAVH